MLQVKNLTKHYGAIQSVNDISFGIGEKEVVGLLGPNGAGKSTTMRMLTGYLAPTSGTVTLFGEDVFENPKSARKNIGYLPELPPLYLGMTVREQLRFVCDLRGVGKKQREAEVLRVCKALHIEDVSGRPIKNLSKGYRQRVGFAGAIVGSPKLLILDEPTVGLDPRQIIEIRDLIQALSKEMTVMISSHILTEIASVCGRLIIMKKGRVLANGTSAEIEQDFGGGSRTELVVRGDAQKAAQVLQGCAGAVEIEELPASEGEARFVVSGGREDLRERIFQGFAAQALSLSLVTLRPLQKSLEEIFIEITRG